MNFKLIYTESYIKRAKRFLKKHPEIVGQYEKTLKLLEIKPHHPSLRLHQLKGKLKDLHSVSINISYRITIEFYFNDKEIILINVGQHDDIY
jgi:mRNA-degrading endonuclease YafQ of YafQ-DinJ toxin-antitoxin module